MQCKGNKKYHICENNKSIRMDKLEEIIQNAINDLLDNYYDKNNLKELYENRRMQDTNNNERINILEKEKEILKRKQMIINVIIAIFMKIKLKELLTMICLV